jgi:DNA-binding transcriptional MerR regulator
MLVGRTGALCLCLSDALRGVETGGEGSFRGKIPKMVEEPTRGNNAGSDRDIEATSGWVTTQQAARALGITARTIRWHIDKGNLAAKPQGEGVRRSWLVSIDSLQAFRDTRQTNEARRATGDIHDTDRSSEEYADISPDIPGNTIRELIDRLVEEAARASEYRIRLELTEQTQSTLEAVLAEERRQREEAEREREQAEQERDELRRQLEALQETPGAAESDESGHYGTTSRQEAEESLQGASERRSWWRRFFGLE